MKPTTQLCTFTVSGTHFGLEVEHVQEVIRFQEMARVPLAPDVVEGLINLRGQIVTALDMRRRFGFPPRANGDLPMNVVLTPDHGSVSLLVDEIGDVLELEDQQLDSPPPTIANVVRELVRGVYKLDGRLLLVLKPGRTIEFHQDDAA